jgi:diacylglycerol kinase family enzyme
MPGIGLITNPRARANVRDPSKIRQLGYLLGSRGELGSTHSLDDLYRVVEAFRKERIDVLAINGGDGTIHVTLSAFLAAYGDEPLPPVALLRGGTMNMVATALGVRGEPGQLLFDLVDRYHANEPPLLRRRTILRVGDAYGFVFGTGLMTNFLRKYYESPHPTPARAAYILGGAVLSAVFGGPMARQLFQRSQVRVTADGQRWARPDYLTVVCATIDQLGFGFTPFPRAAERLGAFQVLGLHCKPFEIPAELWSIWRGRPIRRDKTIDEVVSTLELRMEQPLDYTIDGDLYKSGEKLAISAGPTIDFILPP